MPINIAVREADALSPVEQYDECDCRYLFVQPQLGMFLITVYAGREMSEHVHADFHQFIYVVEGRGLGVVGERSVNLRPGVGARVPAGVPHRWRNTGEGPLCYLELKIPARPDVDVEGQIEAAMPGIDRRRLAIDLD